PADPTAPAQPTAPAPADPAPAGSAKPATPAKPGKTVVKKSAKKLPNTGAEAASLALLSGALLAGGALAVRRRRAA
ncbi:LPXTG cell wall anchor domain-containing protein, partial [Actinotignum timonense]